MIILLGSRRFAWIAAPLLIVPYAAAGPAPAQPSVAPVLFGAAGIVIAAALYLAWRVWRLRLRTVPLPAEPEPAIEQDTPGDKLLQLRAYVDRQRARGVPMRAVHEELSGAGWDQSTLDEVFDVDEGLQPDDMMRLKDYVAQAMQNGDAPERLRKELASSGWPEEIVDEIFRSCQ